MIPFPKIHIAQSVINRILNTMDDVGSMSMPAIEPSVPDPTIEGAAIDEKVNAPAAPVAAADGNEAATGEAMVESSLTGGSPFDGALAGNVPI